MARDQIRYDLLTQDALRNVIRRVLADVAREGVPGDHHFYITFKTGHPGVRLSPRLRETYPDEMTVILQHQFWDLTVGDSGFEVGLAFGGVPERLMVPFEAITGFFDPSVQFGVKFEVELDEGAQPRAATPTRAPGAGSEPELTSPAPRAQRGKSPPADLKSVPVEEKPADENGAAVVRLDTFRKKP